MRRSLLVLALLGALSATALGATSGASFTSTSQSPGSGITTAASFTTVVTPPADDTPPTGVVTMPPNGSQASPVRITGAGVDAESGVASVTVQVRVDEGAWTTACTGPGPVVDCEVVLGRGRHTLEARLVVTDVAGNTTTTDPVSANVVIK